MNSTVEFINDEGKINLQAGDLFDRIINLKIICKDEKGVEESFVIRSDYELIPSGAGYTYEKGKTGFIIRRCTQKPSIKVNLKMVTSNVGTAIGITVSNFFMLTQDGKHLRSFNSKQYKITAVEVVMGYWGQLKDSVDVTADAQTQIKQYFNIQAINGADKIAITDGKPIVVTTEKLPPDSAIHIKGYVADIYTNPVAVTKINTPVKALSDPVAVSGTEFEQVLFENITRRYISGHKVLSETEKALAKVKTLPPVSSMGSEITIGNDVVKPEEDTGKLTVTDAKKYGVRVFLSDEAKKTQIQKVLDSAGNEVNKKVYFEAGWTIGQTVSRIISYMDKALDYTFSLDGDLLIYTPDEMQDPELLNKAYAEQGLYKGTVLYNEKLYNGRLPAVYNINIDAVATITCPFFTFIQPFQYVEFASRYALTSLVAYYAQYNPTIYRFLVINATVAFATVDDINEVHITAVSARDSVTAGDEE